MELLSRRKHSTATTNAPYDGVFVGRGKPLEAHEYTEIFARSSSAPLSIPVLDFPGLDERAGPGDFRVPVREYSRIFGGLSNEDVAVPYQDLFGGFAQKAKPHWKSPDLLSPLQHSNPSHSSGITKNNGKSVGVLSPLQHSSFSRPSENTKRPTCEASNQRNSDAPNRKMHIAELHSVSGFQQKADDPKPIPHSFGANTEDAKGKRRLRPDRSEGNLKLHSSTKLPSSSSLEKLSDAKDPKQSRALNFAPKEDASKKSAVGHSPPFLDEEFDENSVAAASAAALKKAIEQAQESIRVAKMIMERKKEGHRDRYKTRSRDDREDLDKESKICSDSYASNEHNSAEYEEADNTGKRILSFDQNDAVTKAGNVGSVPEQVKVAEGCGEEVARGPELFTSKAQKNVEIGELTKERGESFAMGGESFASLFLKDENIYVGEKVHLEMHSENVEAAKGHGEEVERGAKLVIFDCDQSEEIHVGEKAQLDSDESTEINRVATFAGHRFANLVFGEVVNNDNLVNMSNLINPCSRISGQGDVTVKPKLQSKGIFHGEKAQKNVEIGELTIERGEEFAMGGESFASLFRKDENIYVGEKVQLEMNSENVEAPKVHGEEVERGAKLVVSDCEIHLGEKAQLDNAESAEIDRVATFAGNRCANLGSGVVVNNDNLVNVSSLINLCSEISGQVNVTVKAKLQKMQDPMENVEETESEATFVHAKVSEDIFEPVERVPDTPQSTIPGKAVGEDAENTKISLEDEVGRISKNNMDEDERKSEECDEMQNGEHWTALESGSSETNHVVGHELFEQEVIEKVAENVSCGEETEHGVEEENGMKPEEVHVLFESKESPKEALEEEIGEREASVSPEMVEADKKIETYEPEIDKDWSPANERDEPKLPEELNLDNIEERPNGIPEHEAAESRTVEAEKSVADGNICDFVYDDNSDEAADLNTIGACPVFSKVRETYVIDSNGEPIPYQETVNSNVENGSVPEETEAEIKDDAEAKPLFHQETDELPAVDSLHRSACEEILLEGKQQNVFEGLSSDGEPENDNVTDSAGSNGKLSEDDHVFETDDGEILPGVVPSDGEKQELNITDVTPVLEETSESDQGSESTSSLDNIDQFSARESEGDAENVKDETSSKVEAIRGEEMSSNIDKEEGDKDVKKVVENAEVQQRIEAIKKAREQEKDRLVVERAIREARERAFAEACQRAARAAAVKTASEACQSHTAESHKKLDKASTEAKLRAERAAVERATVEARERALEKALSQKMLSEPRTNVGLKHSFSSSDLENSTYTESARRRQARLERHQRIMERAAKALAEKNKRDILAQKEQAERNRLAESLDAEIKRWATGKEGNLRALLSTLQYILGRDSGWHPIPLTEIVTAAAVKKAYRKATLYVHPDKLQQRGASIQQKYICEKVFDLLKAAWNRFNSEER